MGGGWSSVGSDTRLNGSGKLSRESPGKREKRQERVLRRRRLLRGTPGYRILIWV